MQTNFGVKGLEEEVPETRTGEDCLDDNRSESGIEKAPGPSKKSLENCQSSNGSSSSLYQIDGRSVLR